MENKRAQAGLIILIIALIIVAVLLIVFFFIGITPAEFNVDVEDAPTNITANEPFDLSWSVTGENGSEISRTAIYFGLNSSEDPEDPPANYSDSSDIFCVDEDCTVPENFTDELVVDDAGTYFYRAYAEIEGENFWSDEKTFTVSPIGNDTNETNGMNETNVTEFQNLGFGIILMETIEPNEPNNLTSMPYMINIDNETFESPVEFTLLEADPSNFTDVVPQNETPIFAFAINIENEETGEEITTFPPIEIVIQDEEIENESKLYALSVNRNITPVSNFDIFSNRFSFDTTTSGSAWIITNPTTP